MLLDFLFIVFAMMMDGEINRLEGAILFAGMLFFTITLYLLAMRQSDGAAGQGEAFGKRNAVAGVAD
jgi:uncharacterized membrane protein YgdD (TMEM256/DUF423 family)